jgi:hypothetical protein
MNKQAEQRFKKDVARIEKAIAVSPAPDEYLEHERKVVYNILHKPIDLINDCTDVVVAGQKTRYYRTGYLDWPLDQIRLIRHHYKLFISGIMNKETNEYVDAVRFYHLEKWLQLPIKKKTLPYKSIYRVRAFYIYLMYLDGRITKEEIESRGRITDIINREFPPEKPTSGKQTYDELRSKESIYSKYLMLKEKYKADFEYGEKLYQARYKD